jgi:hypothetical protein
MAQGRSAKEQIGVELPDPAEPEAVPQPPEEPEERPDFLLDKFKTVEEQARSYAEAERRINESVESQRRLEQQIAQLTEVVEGFTPPEQPQPLPNDDALKAQIQDMLDRDPVSTIAYLAQQYAQQTIDERLAAIQQQTDPQTRATQERDNQLLAMMVDQRLGETIPDWDDYRDRVGEAIVADQSLIPEEVLNNPEATVTAIRRVYQVVKAGDVLAQAENGGYVSDQMKRSAQTMTGGGVRGPIPSATDEKMDALKRAVEGVSYSAWRGSS